MKLGKYIGVMSGTSLDNIDVVLANIDTQRVMQLATYTHAIPFTIKQAILSVCQGQKATLAFVGQLDAKLGELYADAVLVLLKQNNIKAEEIIAIGNHGQTVWHEPKGRWSFSWQLGDNNRIAALTGITTVGDFRRRDMVLGGQGAPLVPLFHQWILSHPQEKRMILNIGGIANLSLLFPGKALKGFDTGPGNLLIDSWISEHRDLPYDKDATWAKTGVVNENLLHIMLADPYFAKQPPKSSGREYFNSQWIHQHVKGNNHIRREDVQATLTELTARTIAQQVILEGGCQRLLVCGGGVHNPLIMQRLIQLLPDIEVSPTDAFGLSGDNMEALAFAWLASRTLSGKIGNSPSVTGAQAETILGAIYPVN